MANKTTCPITKEQFRKAARPLLANIEGQPQAVASKEFSTGSLGWYQQGKVTLMVDGVPVTCQCSISLQIVGSKEAA